jgi:hypothetical protein
MRQSVGWTRLDSCRMASSKFITIPWRPPSRGTYRLREFVLAYVAALTITCLVTLAGGVLGLAAYLAAGVLLSRWNQQASVANVCRAKVRFIARWVYEMPRLVVEVFVARDL